MYTILNGVDNFQIAKLIFENNIILYFNGSSEAGCRALGNRSILSNPLLSYSNFIINEVKGREWFRPVAASILEEETEKWFYVENLKKSPFMTYVFKSKENTKKLIPSILHVDGTCRLQTVNILQNFNFYNLLKDFFNISRVPILMNTSFNLAGEPIVETPQDAIKSFKRSNFNFLYFADVKVLLKK